jgi:UDP-N-acetylmuramate dehydrogenase
MASFEIKKDVDLASLTTMKIGGKAKYLVEILSSDQLSEVLDWAKGRHLPYYLLGGGSNTVFDDGYFEGLVIAINIKGIEKVEDEQGYAIVRIGAGEDWDYAVEQVVGMELWGMEALSGIPGNNGATPYQNIGAYGQEVKDTIDRIDVYDTQKASFDTLANDDCKFGYRDSIFKSSQKGRYIITNVYFKLSKKPLGVPTYKDVVQYFQSKSIDNPNIHQIREAILEIRKTKFVDPSIMPNSGSFFKNPVVDAYTAEKLMERFPEVKPYPQDNKIFPVENNQYKIAAGWLLQELGFKGKDFGKIRIDPNHALVIENKDGATKRDLLKVVDQIIKEAREKFGIKLEPEPVIVDFQNFKA